MNIGKTGKTRVFREPPPKLFFHLDTVFFILDDQLGSEYNLTKKVGCVSKKIYYTQQPLSVNFITTKIPLVKALDSVQHILSK